MCFVDFQCTQRPSNQMAPPLPAELALIVHNRTRAALDVQIADGARSTLLLASSSLPFRLESVATATLLLRGSVTLSLSLANSLWKRRRGRSCRTTRLTPPDSGAAVFALFDPVQRVLILLVIEEPDRASWMSLLPDEQSLAEICMPGTHETLAEYGWPHSTCQTSQSVKRQLERGCRFLDLRFSLNRKGTLRAYHDLQPEYILASAVFAELYDFLDQHPSETVICSIKQENGVRGFQAAVMSLIEERLDLWYLENAFPTLGEVRGKCILFSRFGEGAKLGIHPSSWPNNSPDIFDWQLDNVTVRTQDWYDLGSILAIPEKAAKVFALLDGPRPPSTWRLDFASASSVLLGAFPCTVSKGFGFSFAGLGIRGVNARLVDWLVTRACSGVPLDGCTVLLDYFETPHDSLVTLLIGFNFDRMSAKGEKGIM